MSKPKTVYRAAKELKPVRKATKKAAVIMALQKGATVEDLMKVTGWARTAAASSISTDVASAGYGVTLKDHTYRLVLPRGVRKPLFI